jgi:predicted metal-dependent phosphoesterase TrpH
MLRADLHVHSCHSGLTGNLAFLRSLDCYSEPDAVYRQARARGMDLVTITDHDSIDGVLELLSCRPDATDVFMGEEISCWWPGTSLEVHVAAYGHTESDHRELQRLRTNVHDVLAYLRAQRILAAVNHPFHFYRGQVPPDQYVQLLTKAGGVEARNGAMLRAQNELTATLAASLRAEGSRCGMVAGSDSHTLRRVGLTWTAAAGTTREAFLASLRDGGGEPGGRHGTWVSLSADVYGVVAHYWASLAGLTRQRHSVSRRALGLGFSLLSLPFQFTPAFVAAAQQSSEAAHCREYARALVGDRPPALGAMEGEQA